MKKLIGIATLALALLATAVFAATGTATVQCNQDSDCTPTILNLCTKDSTTWQCIPGATAVLTFDQSGAVNSWHLTTHGLPSLQTSTDWALIYYPDQATRFTNWNGAGGIVLVTWAGDANGPVNPPAVDLPIAADWNAISPANYCNKANGFDSYAHCNGAKIWIVPTSDLTSSNSLPLLNWNPTKWLFETDLIEYSTHKIATCSSNQCVLTPKTCGVSATGIAFGTLAPGATVGPKTSTVTNSGNSPTTALYISGTDWTPYMPVGQTDWRVESSWNPLTSSNVVTGATVPANSGTTNVDFQLTVPSGQATGSYSQTITFTGSC